MSLLVGKFERKACTNSRQDLDCSVKSAGKMKGAILTNGAMNMLLMHCSESLLHCAGQTCHKATSMKADLTVADSCELSKASAASCAMCLLQRQQPLDHLMVLVIDNVNRHIAHEAALASDSPHASPTVKCLPSQITADLAAFLLCSD